MCTIIDKRYIGHVLSKDDHDTLLNRLQESKMFIWPISLKDSSRYYVLVSQYQHKHVFFTSADSFHHSANKAVPYLVMTLYDDLIWNKQIALVRSEVVDPIHLTIENARSLCEDFFSKYLKDETFDKHINVFNHFSADFDVQKYLETHYEFVKKARELNIVNAQETKKN
ncbi:hypothetical protein RFI_05161 [Reticulomyxa filosa]|uniref:Uncharacterized protein n=1 Tax=Reticulomyxa filosa TaxID=46433 RepID=X6P160_RETFI|nr:hypothetical protein RFI_05161 [Reticulomyxa filosa]|eukprot:ETO31956.1 hypothetical protein RFI_05161 [Reticulomyxa filosa]